VAGEYTRIDQTEVYAEIKTISIAAVAEDGIFAFFFERSANQSGSA
jgi:hypothetical protein